MRKKIFIGILCLSAVIILLFLPAFIFQQYRHFYKVGAMIFTFWKTENGCYIMPYKYRGIKMPKDNLNPYKYLRDLLPEKITQRNILKP